MSLALMYLPNLFQVRSESHNSNSSAHRIDINCSLCDTLELESTTTASSNSRWYP